MIVLRSRRIIDSITVDIVFGYWLAVGTFVLYHMYTQVKQHRRLKSEAHLLLVTYLFQVRTFVQGSMQNMIITVDGKRYTTWSHAERV